jgi:prepilin-type N-terminal cleavage/methylation domain-containing protein
MKKGFTIVELLVVIVVIAILAVITLVAFNGVQSRARASQLTSSLGQGKRKLELYKVDNGTYPLTGSLSSAGVTNGNNTFYQYTSDGTTFCLTASNGGTSYSQTGTGAATSGNCTGHVSGGLVTNLTSNPSFESNANDWQEHNIRPFVRTSAWAQNGTNSVLATNNTASTVPLYIHHTAAAQVAVSPNTSYTVSGYVREFGGTPTAYVRVRWLDSSKTVETWTGWTTVNITSTGQRISITATSPANAAYIDPWFSFPSAPPSGGAYLDSVMFTQGITLFPYADGSSADWTWSGAANNSVSSGPPS